jgi:alkylation response protein AidB-like acyl-CoA dehydrogenase
VLCCSSVQTSRMAVEECLVWASQRRVFGKPLIGQPVIRQKLASMIAKVEACQAWLEVRLAVGARPFLERWLIVSSPPASERDVPDDQDELRRAVAPSRWPDLAAQDDVHALRRRHRDRCHSDLWRPLAHKDGHGQVYVSGLAWCSLFAPSRLPLTLSFL